MKASQMCQKSSLEVKSITVATPTCVTWTWSAFSFRSPATLELPPSLLDMTYSEHRGRVGGRWEKETAVTLGGLCRWVNCGAVLQTTKDAVVL